MEACSSQSVDDDELTKPMKDSIAATLSKLKRKVLANRGVDVTDKMRSNSAKLRKYSNYLHESAKQWGGKSVAGEDKLTFRKQKVLHNFTNADSGSDGIDDGHNVVAPVIFGTASGGKTTVRPLKVPTQPNVPPYTTWIYLDRNQRMTEDQSVQGRRRIYYDPVGNETLIASDSEEEELEEEEPKHDFSKGEDYIIWTAVQERGASALLFEQISQCIRVNLDEVEVKYVTMDTKKHNPTGCAVVQFWLICINHFGHEGVNQARYELLLKDLDKQAKCAAHGEGIRLKVPSPVGRRKGTRDLGRLTYKETQPGPKEYFKTAGNGATIKQEDEKVEAKDLVAAMDSFDNLFCRRCLVFDCRLHGCSQPLVHPVRSQRQLSTIPDSEPTVPCGPHCYLQSQQSQQSQQARREVSNPSFPAVMASQAGELACAAERADRARVSKRQKEGETSSGGEKRGAGIANFDRAAKFSLSASQMYSSIGKALKLSVNGKDKDVAPVQTSGTPVTLSSKDGSGPLKREPASVASRLTSHKKLARSTTRRALEEKNFLGGESQHRQSQGNFIDLTGMDVDFSTENGNGPPKDVVGEMMDILTRFQEHQVKYVSKDGHGEGSTFHQEKTRFSSTKKLARSTKRALEENTQSTVKTQQNLDLDQSGFGTDVPVAKRLARTGDNGIQEKFMGDVRTPLRSAGVNLDSCYTESVLFKETSKGTSPKKLARSARKPIAGKLVGTVEGQISQKLLLQGQDVEHPVKEEKTRNSAARKLARSSRKVVAEKVAVAIQKHQLQSQVDLVGISRGEKEHVKEEIVDTGGTSQVLVIADTTVAVSRGENTRAQLANRDSNPNRHIMGYDEGDGSKDVEIKCDQAPAGPTKVGILVKGMTPKNSENPSKQAGFKDDWTALEKGLYEKGLQIFGKNSCLIAKSMLKGCKSCEEVREYMLAQDAAAKRGFQFPDSMTCLKWDVARARARFNGRRKGSRKLKFTLKSAGQSAIRKRLVNGKDVPKRQYTPCGCLYFCGKQCPCQLNGTSCEKYCGCEKSCKNRFRGCHCAKSQCSSRQCPCFASDRECDPDVCRNCWIGCGDGQVAGPPRSEDKDDYQCQNMKLLLKQQQRVLLGRSDVAGWGAFLKNTVSKHEYLGEYTGELISHREADKRGKIYDRENSSFLFNLNDQYVLDACRKGDKLKFANHSPNPNCYAKVMMVAGDHRVGIFAKERILAGEELFYDYRYEPERAPSWAKRGDGPGNGKKDDPGPSERRSKQAS